MAPNKEPTWNFKSVSYDIDTSLEVYVPTIEVAIVEVKKLHKTQPVREYIAKLFCYWC